MDYGVISTHIRRHLALRFWAAGPDRYSMTQESSVTIKCRFTRDSGFGRRFFALQVRFWPIDVKQEQPISMVFVQGMATLAESETSLGELVLGRAGAYNHMEVTAHL
jgi:hypothetical protein